MLTLFHTAVMDALAMLQVVAIPNVASLMAGVEDVATDVLLPTAPDEIPEEGANEAMHDSDVILSKWKQQFLENAPDEISTWALASLQMDPL